MSRKSVKILLFYMKLLISKVLATDVFDIKYFSAKPDL